MLRDAPRAGPTPDPPRCAIALLGLPEPTPWSVRARSRMARKPPTLLLAPYSPPRSSRIVGGFLKPRSAGSLPPTARISPFGRISISLASSDSSRCSSCRLLPSQVRPSPAKSGYKRSTRCGSRIEGTRPVRSGLPPPPGSPANLDREETRAGFLPSFRGFAGVGCNTRRPGGAERAVFIVAPGLVSRFPGGGGRLRRPRR